MLSPLHVVLEWVSVPDLGPACLIFSFNGCLTARGSQSSFPLSERRAFLLQLLWHLRLRGDLGVDGTVRTVDLPDLGSGRGGPGGVGWAGVHGSGRPASHWSRHGPFLEASKISLGQRHVVASEEREVL